MKTRQGYVQGYNAQAVVSEEQIIVAVGVTQEANDAQQLEPMLQTMAHTLEAAGIEDRPQSGAWPMPGTGVRPISGLAPGQRCLSFLLPPPRIGNIGRCYGRRGVPEGVYQRTESEGQDGAQAADKARPSSVQEAGCTGGAGVRTGQGKARGSDGFMRRGLGAAQSEWSLAGTTHNLLKLWRSGQAPWPKPKAPWN